MRAAGSHEAGRWLLAACAVWLIGLGIYFIFLRPPLLPEDLRYTGLRVETLGTVAPHLTAWLGKVFTVMGGFMAGAGILTLYLARTLPPRPSRALPGILALSGAATVGLMSAVNFALDSDFRWLLLVPAFVWAAASVLLASAARKP